ncbi:ion channel [uncultured Tateyamaria sp.]|uniref:ion channel n=1 Tax=uncultured Tateyamaria sp. TaxID=455651 RepID=UPI002632EBC4|nr:ion channel [uncultured Tateyamaria sp.]
MDLKWWLLSVFAAMFFVVSWVFFRLAGEAEITESLATYVYFAATTASTVGYGDMSPQTQMGRMIAAFWFFPGSLLIFSAALGRLAGGMVERIRRMADGFGSYETLHHATVIVGYNRDHTPVMIENLIAGQDGDKDIVLLTSSTEGDLPEGVKLVKSDRLDALSSLKRAAIPNAEKVMVYANSDAETFNTCLAIRELNETLHIAAFFEDRDTARRAAKLAGLEAIVSNASEALVRAAQDPGAGQVLMAMSAANVGATVYSATVGANVEVASLRAALYASEATLISLRQSSGDEFEFAPFPSQLMAGGTFYYLCQERLSAGQISDKIEGADVSITV